MLSNISTIGIAFASYWGLYLYYTTGYKDGYANAKEEVRLNAFNVYIDEKDIRKLKTDTLDPFYTICEYLKILKKHMLPWTERESHEVDDKLRSIVIDPLNTPDDLNA